MQDPTSAHSTKSSCNARPDHTLGQTPPTRAGYQVGAVRMSIKVWIWKPMVAGLAGTVVHFAFMYLRSRLGLLPSFQPYQSFQAALSNWVGTNVPAAVPWLLSFLNGMTILGFLFGRLNRLLPGRTGLSKGLSFGLIGWSSIAASLSHSEYEMNSGASRQRKSFSERQPFAGS